MSVLDGLPQTDMSSTVGSDNEATIGAGVGIGQLIQAHQAKKAANANMPSLVDTGQSAMLAELNQKRKSIDVGSQYAAGMNAIDETTAQTNNAITQNTGGDVAGTVAALIQSARASGTAKNAVLGQAGQQQEFYTGMYGNLVNDMASRRLDLQMSEHQQKLAEWAQLRKKGMENLLAAGAGIQNNIGSNVSSMNKLPSSLSGGGTQISGMEADSALPIEAGGAAGIEELAPLLLV